MNATVILHTLEGLGVTVTLDGDEIVARPGSLVPPDLIPAMKACKPQLIDELKKRGENDWLTTLPFPLGLKGLPATEVRAALAWYGYQGIKDSGELKLGVLMWVMGTLAYNGDTGELHRQIKAEYHRLRHIEFPGQECGFCVSVDVLVKDNNDSKES
ncbi:MAG: hypothetical protein O7E55_03065 [Chloroflexi bacterium]|nr:hypothetical protein [Chloroflexota bacterium]